MRHVIALVNPAAGHPQPILSTLNQSWPASEVTWEVVITSGDPAVDRQRLRDRLAQGPTDVVAAYGGDGTQQVAASAILEQATSRPALLVLPGGTGNALAAELAIPAELGPAARLLLQPDARRIRLPVGRVDGEPFLLRVSFGLPAAIPLRAKDYGKAQLGFLAYVMAAVEGMDTPEAVPYQLKIDGEPLSVRGVGAVVTSMGALGRGLRLPVDVKLEEPTLELIVFQGVWETLAASVNPESKLLKRRVKQLIVDVPEGVVRDVDGETVKVPARKISIADEGLTVIGPN